MVVGLGVITFRIRDCRSLKEKKGIVKSIVKQMQNNFNVSVAEIGALDVYQRTEIGFSLVSADRRMVNSKMDKMLNMVDELGLAEMLHSDLEIINL